MGFLRVLVTIMHLLFCVSIIIIVLLQSAKTQGLAGIVAGGAESFFGKNKGRTIDAMLNKYTKIAAIAFLITSIVLQLIIINA
jgi:preprotein translocase subunit SecG